MRSLEEKWRKIIREEIDKENLVGAELVSTVKDYAAFAGMLLNQDS